MLNDIAPGTKVTVKVTQDPTNVAAKKTLRRVLSKDATVKQENARQAKVREKGLRITQRGGRPWEVRVVKQHAVEGKAGESGTIVASLDVLRDLRSVERFIDVTPA